MQTDLQCSRHLGRPCVSAEAREGFQEGFAHYCGLDRSYMGGVERGERNVTLVNMERIIAALDMKPSEFFLTLDGHFRDLAVQRDAAHLNDFAPYFRPGIPRKHPKAQTFLRPLFKV